RARQGLASSGNGGFGTASRRLRPRAHRVHHLRAARTVRPLGQGADLLRAVPVLPSRHVSAPADLHEVGASAVSVFRVDDLGVHFGGVQAVNAVSFAVQRGEVFTLIGPNGAGKTTIFNLIGSLHSPTSGAAWLEDRRLTGLAPHRVAELGIARTF